MMKSCLTKIMLFALSWTIVGQVVAQEDGGKSNFKGSEINFDQYVSPSVPVLQVMDLENVNVEEPHTLAEFEAVVRTATDEFSSVPANFAVAFSPSAFIKKDSINVEDSKIKWDWKNNLNFSIGVDAVDESDFFEPATRIGVGTRINIFQGKPVFEQESLETAIKSFDKKSKELAKGLESTQREIAKEVANNYARSLKKEIEGLNSLAKDENINLFENYKIRIQRAMAKGDGEFRKVIDSLKKDVDRASNNPETDEDTKFNLIKRKINISTYSTNYLAAKETRSEITQEFYKNTIKDNFEDVKLSYVGWKLDFAAAAVLAAPQNGGEDVRFHTAAAWLNGGWSNPGNAKINPDAFGIYGVARARLSTQYAPESGLVLAEVLDSTTVAGTDPIDILNFDIGGRLQFKSVNKKFTFALEGIYRYWNDMGEDLIDQNGTWRLAAMTELTLPNDKSVAFTFGRDFDGTRTGNIIAAINLILGWSGDKIAKTPNE